MTTGYITLPERATPSGAPSTGKTKIEIDADGDLVLIKDDGTTVKIAAAGSYTLTIPATGTAALRDVAQTFSAQQTFSQAPIAPGMKPAADSTTAIQLMNAAGSAVMTVDTTNSRVIPAAIGVGVAANLLQRHAAGVVRQAVETTTLANDGTLAVSASNSGFVFLSDLSDGAMALFSVAGAGGTLIAGSSSVFSGTAGTASRMNVYATGGQITVQNKLGATKTIWVIVLG